MIKERRKTISDNLITDNVYENLLGYTFFKLQDMEVTQMNIIKTLLPKNISNATIARIINDIILEARATKGSVASQIRSMNKQSTEVDELLADIEKEMMNG